MSTYGTMQDRIANEINRTDLTAEIQQAIQSSIKYYESERFWFNVDRAYVVTSTSTEYYSVPTDFIDADSLIIEMSNRKYALAPRTFEWIDGINTTTTYTGYPTDYTIYDQQFRLYPIPDASYTLTLAYHRELTAVSATADSNAWFTDAEEMIRARAERNLYKYVLRQYDHGSRMSINALLAEQEMKRRNTKYMSVGKIKGYQL